MNKTLYAGLITLLLVVSTSAIAARPSINELNTRVNQLEAQVRNLEHSHIMWVDANDVPLGDAQTDVNAGVGSVYFEVGGRFYRTHIGDAEFIGEVYYDGIGCVGNVYSRSKENITTNVVDLYSFGMDGMSYVTSSDVPQNVALKSRWYQSGSEAECFDVDQSTDVYPAVPVIDTNIYAKPYKLKLIPSK